MSLVAACSGVVAAVESCFVVADRESACSGCSMKNYGGSASLDYMCLRMDCF